MKTANERVIRKPELVKRIGLSPHFQFYKEI